MPNAISIASDDATECTPPQTPHTRLEMYCASRGSRPFKMTSYPRNSVPTVCASWTVRCSRSTTQWNASAPATRVTGSRLMSLTWPLLASSFSTFERSRSRRW